MIRTAAILSASFLCLLAAASCGRYVWRFLAEPSNAYRHEFLGGAILTGFAVFPVWGTLLFFALYPGSGLAKWQRGVGITAAGIAFLGLVAPFALDLLT